MSRVAVIEQSGGGSGKGAGAGKEQGTKHRSAPKVKFTPSEDNLLRKLVAKYGENKWEEVASQIPGRNIRQCHDRWFYYLNPNVKKTPWTEEEENLLFKCVKEIGPHWVRITRFFEGRTDTQIKNKWNVLKRRMEYDNKFAKDNKAANAAVNATKQATGVEEQIDPVPVPINTPQPQVRIPQQPVLPVLATNDSNPIKLPSLQEDISPQRTPIPPIHIMDQMVPPPPAPANIHLPPPLLIPPTTSSSHKIAATADIHELLSPTNSKSNAFGNGSQPIIKIQPVPQSNPIIRTEPKIIVKPIPQIHKYDHLQDNMNIAMPELVMPMPPKVIKKLETGTNPFAMGGMQEQTGN